MEYTRIVKGIFKERKNRFIAEVLLNGNKETVHVKNTGRCKELLVPGATVYLCESDSSSRKTKFDLVAVEKKRDLKTPLLINMDSQAPNLAVSEWLPKSGLFSPSAEIKREVFYKRSRFDFFIRDGDKKTFLEVKGVTLEENGRALFPDAPTERGIKHLEELVQAKREGFDALVLFVIQMKGIASFSPNRKTHPQFAEALQRAREADVKILAFDCIVSKDGFKIDQPVSVLL